MARPKQILLLVETSRVFGRGVIEGIARFGRQHDWLFHFEDRGIREGLSPRLKNWSGDGVITRSSTVALEVVFAQLKCPVVELLGDGQRLVAEVHTDEEQTAAMAVEHLQQQGYEHFAFYSIATSWWSNSRRDAFLEVTRRKELSAQIFSGAYRGKSEPFPTWKRSDEPALLRWLERLPKPVGIWAVTDSQAIKILEACRKLQLRVPAEVGILGTTNDELVCSLLTPSISSIDLNSQEVGFRAASLLEQKMQAAASTCDQAKFQHAAIRVPPKGVVERQSSRRLELLDPDLDAAIQLINQHALDNWGVDQLANALCMSRSTLERRFRRLFHCSPAQEISRRKLERAKCLLRETSWPISTVGYRTGFESPENFVRFFKRLVGQTPRQYRLEHQADPS